MPQEDPETLAIILMVEIKQALDRGTKHFAKDGRPLTTVDAIVEALFRDGEITFEPAPQKES